MLIAVRAVALTPVLILGTMLREVPAQPAQRAADRVDRITSNPIAPIIFIVVIAVVAFIALAVVIGALAAYIYFCQAHGGRWPGFTVPGASGGTYSLRCVR